jgi:hypothetical protein
MQTIACKNPYIQGRFKNDTITRNEGSASFCENGCVSVSPDGFFRRIIKISDGGRDLKLSLHDVVDQSVLQNLGVAMFHYLLLASLSLVMSLGATFTDRSAAQNAPEYAGINPSRGQRKQSPALDPAARCW